VYEWEALEPERKLAGPSLIAGRSATALIPPGWAARVNGIGAIVVEPGGA
jgi:N-methylhydantoinase A/oxoprolinase/acetone carboxylase beta subunit